MGILKENKREKIKKKRKEKYFLIKKKGKNISRNFSGAVAVWVRFSFR